ncbi:hypothetical protein FPV16_06915 [Methylobacterium sp. W2]|uniref:primase-helicase family protein n=1 Tax=Methylobacterium sp. W2 TaxID=2598107 RepID=UPI001D0C5728|nr:primase-helicase family protein [Methylobacterium sp. W2]MCC0805956.1 hypothetical protein [Methylobacterium sp. W2]
MSNLVMSQSSGNETLDFFNEIFRGARKGNAVLWVKQSGKSVSFDVSDLVKASSKATGLSVDDVYVGRGLQAEPKNGAKRGKQEEVVFVGGLFADIDFRGGEHSAAAATLPADMTEAMELIHEAGLPAPTMTVFTGGGAHTYWNFIDPLMIETAEDRATAKMLSAAWQAKLRRTFIARGYILDATQDLSRVVRVPGTFNRKNGGAVPVRIVSRGERIDQAAAIALVVGEMEAPTEPAGSEALAGILSSAASSSLKGISSTPEAAPMILGCAFVRHCIENAATLSEPHWYAYLSLIGFCETGHEIAHETSAAHPGYSAEATDAKLMQAVTAAKPMLCAHAAEVLGFEGCKTCPFYGGINSPIALGYQEMAIVEAQLDAIYDLETDRFYVPSNGDVLRRTAVQAVTRPTIGKDPLDRLFASRTMPLARRLDYLPGETRLMITSGGAQPTVNMWKPDGVVPVAGDAGPILRHFGYLWPKTAERDHVLNYIAHLIQHPGVKIAHGLMITGTQGTGKSTVGLIVRALIGDRNARKVEGDELKDKWTSRLVNVQVLMIEEAAHGQRYEIYERFKELFTGETFTVQDKGVPLYDGRCPRGMILLTNHDAAITVTGEDRRLHVSETTETPATPDYFKALYAALNDGVTLPAFAAWLHARDISAFNPKAKPPMTEAKARAQDASMTPTADALKTIMTNGMYPFHRDIVTVEEVRAALLASGYFPATERLRDGKVVAAIKDIGGRRLNDSGDIRLPGGKKIRAWATRNGAYWASTGLDEIKDEYLRSFGTARPAAGTEKGESANIVTFPHPPMPPHRTLMDFLQSATAAGTA